MGRSPYSGVTDLRTGTPLPHPTDMPVLDPRFTKCVTQIIKIHIRSDVYDLEMWDRVKVVCFFDANLDNGDRLRVEK